jgi:hypothetical protein
MKTILISLVACLCLTAAVAGAGDTPWFDPQNCDMCTAMTEQPGLMEHVTMESHAIGNGMINMATVDPKFLEAYRAASIKMAATGEEMMAGKEMKLCGCCTSMRALLKAGATMEMVPTMHGSVMLVTSSDEALVGKLKAHAERSTMEMEKMMGGHEGHEGHEGHGGR